MIRLLLVLACGAPVAALAQRDRFGPFSAQLATGARALAMGGSTAGTRETEASLGNPALAGAQPSTALSGARYSEGVHTLVVAQSGSAGALGIGVAVQYLDYGRTTRVGLARASDLLAARGATAAASLAASVGASLVWKGMRWGVAGTYLSDQSSGRGASVLAASAGVARDGVGLAGSTLGIALQHVGPGLELPERDVPLPSRLAIGYSVAPDDVSAFIDVGVSAGVAVRRDGLLTGSAGAELAFTPIEGISFALRGGARAAELRVQRPLTGGLGLSFDRLALDYAWEQLRDGGAHRVSLRYR